MKTVKSFDLKQCTGCGEEYKHYPAKRIQLCKECTRKHYLAKNRLTDEEYKKNYPLSENERRRRYTRLRRGLESLILMDREEKTEYWDNLLKEIEELGIMEWCIDLRMPVKPLEPGSGKVGRRPNKIADPRGRYPDTRQMHE